MRLTYRSMTRGTCIVKLHFKRKTTFGFYAPVIFITLFIDIAICHIYHHATSVYSGLFYKKNKKARSKVKNSLKEKGRKFKERIRNKKNLRVIVLLY